LSVLRCLRRNSCIVVGTGSRVRRFHLRLLTVSRCAGRGIKYPTLRGFLRHGQTNYFRPALPGSPRSGRERPEQKAKISFQTSLKIVSPNPESDFSRS